MDAYVLEWLNLLVRWAHVIAGIAWIGASFCLIRLDDRPEMAKEPRLAGEPWGILKWEAYWTWLSGFALLVLMYYAGAELYLVDPAVMALSKWSAIGIGLLSLVIGLAIYEAACRSPLAGNETLLSVALLALLAAAAWGLTKIFSGRGAFIHYGAVLGTIMAGNVAHVIIPGQRRMVQAMREGREPDPKDALMGRQRSVHNAYFTLPVVFAMISSHYAVTYGSRWSWLVLAGMTLAGALIRVWFVMRHKGRAPAWVLAAGLLLVVLTAVLLAPNRSGGASSVDFSEVKKIVDTRCASCHAERPAFHGLAEAPKGVKLDTAERIRAQALQVYQQSVLARAMPPGNLTGMTGEERELLDRWFRARD